MSNIAPLSRQSTASLAAVIDRQAVLHAQRPAFIEADRSVTYASLAAHKNQLARWALGCGVRPGQVVCLMMLNGADYAALWLGLTQVGAVAALVNTSLTGDALAHVVRQCGATMMVADDACAAAVQRIRALLPENLECWQTGGADISAGWRRLDAHALRAETLTATEQVPVTGAQTALLLFTSGTTGLPKAARLSHYRVLEWCFWFAGLMNAGPDDRLYDCLPMYHATGGIAGCGAMLVSGGAVVVRHRFSAAAFWPDVCREACTIFLYIGELCRILLQAASGPAPAHMLRLCCGNGLQADIWDRFLARFAIPRVLEFYASTEGNVALYNCEGRRGAVGRLPPYLAHRKTVMLAACDPESGALLRGQDGLCLACPPGTPGEALGRISAGEATRIFEGYTDADATVRKIARDVLAQGDAWFRTGDLMVKDADGFYTFVDRMGDTFRWKGENVATTQVAQAILSCAGVKGCIVYPVAVPGHEGRAGMAAVTTSPVFELDDLAAHLARELPAWAQPVFLRVCARLPSTDTHKPMKSVLAAQGFDPALTTDPLYLRHRAAGTYVRLDAGRHGELLAGTVRL